MMVVCKGSSTIKRDRYRSIPEVEDKGDRVFKDLNILFLVLESALSDLKDASTAVR